MKEKIMNLLPYIIAFVVCIIFIICDIVTTIKPISEYDYDDIDAYARQLVESSEIMVNDSIYGGVYNQEEVVVVPEGYTLLGSIIEMVDDNESLTENFTSHVIPAGYQIYTSKDNTDEIYVKVTTDEEEYQSYLLYVKK